MSIAVTEILGTDSLSGSRTVINTNFTVLKNEINLIETYFDPSSAILDNMNSISSDNLVVGLNTTLLSISASNSSLNTDITINGDVNLTGKILSNNIFSNTISDDTSIGSGTSVPEYGIYRVTNPNGTQPVIIELFEGEIGQEITFVYDKANSGTVSIIAGGSVPFMGTSQIDLNTVGQTVKLLCITNDVGTKEWYILGGHLYSIV